MLPLKLLFIERNVHSGKSMCAGYENSEFHSMSSRLHPLPTLSTERLETAYSTAAANRKMLFDTHNPVAVVELEHAVCGMYTTADHATPSPPFTGKCVTKAQLPGTTSMGLFYDMNITIHISTPSLRRKLVSVILGCIQHSRRCHHCGYSSVYIHAATTGFPCFSVQ
jgi:hypothetical protein